MAGMTRLDPFYPVVGSLDWVQRLVPLGVKLIQLRIKQQPQDAVRQAVRAALACCRAHGAQLVVNDHWQAAIELGAPWIHLGQGDLDHADLAAIRRAGVRLGVSTHDADELARALGVAPDYVALGPIYPTTSKVMPWAQQGLARIGEWKRRIGALPLVAIGGISCERAADCLDAGACAVAAMSDVTDHPAPAVRVAQWLRTTRPRP